MRHLTDAQKSDLSALVRKRVKRSGSDGGDTVYIIALKATPIPPEADPHAPAQIATVIIQNTSGLIERFFKPFTRSANACVF